jgi:hypothetical protein
MLTEMVTKTKVTRRKKKKILILLIRAIEKIEQTPTEIVRMFFQKNLR